MRAAGGRERLVRAVTLTLTLTLTVWSVLLQAALDLYLRAAGGRGRLLGPDHLDTFRSLTAVGSAMRRIGR